MKTFKVYYKESDGYKAVKVGVSFPAFFLGGIWFLYKWAFSVGVIYFLIYIFWFVSRAPLDTYYGDYTIRQIIAELIIAVSQIVAFIKGNGWVEDAYIEDDYHLVKVIQSQNPEAAIAIIMDSNPEIVQDLKDKSRKKIERKQIAEAREKSNKIELEKKKKVWAKQAEERARKRAEKDKKKAERAIKKKEKQKVTSNPPIKDSENKPTKEIVIDTDDAELYLIATEEVEGDKKDSALWAKCIAVNRGDETQAKYDYIKKRVEGLKAEQAEAKKIVEEKEAKKIVEEKEAKKIVEEKEAKRKAERAAKTLERIVAENKELNLSNKAQEMYWEYDGIKFDSKMSMEAYIQIKLSGRS